MAKVYGRKMKRYVRVKKHVNVKSVEPPKKQRTGNDLIKTVNSIPSFALVETISAKIVSIVSGMSTAEEANARNRVFKKRDMTLVYIPIAYTKGAKIGEVLERLQVVDGQAALDLRTEPVSFAARRFAE